LQEKGLTVLKFNTVWGISPSKSSERLDFIEVYTKPYRKLEFTIITPFLNPGLLAQADRVLSLVFLPRLECGLRKFRISFAESSRQVQKKRTWPIVDVNRKRITLVGKWARKRGD